MPGPHWGPGLSRAFCFDPYSRRGLTAHTAPFWHGVACRRSPAGQLGAPAYPGGVPHCGRTTRSGRRNTAARLPLAPAYPGGVPHCGRTTRSRRQRANEAARAGRPEGPAASPRGRRQPLCHHGGHSRAALDTAPNALHPFGGRNAHNCGAAAEGHHDANKYIYNPTLTHNQPSQPVSHACETVDSQLHWS